MTGRLTDEQYRAGVQTEIALFTGCAAVAPLDTPVPTCPEWTFADLVGHMGRIHRWVGGIIEQGLTERPDRGDIDYGDRRDLATWQAEGSARLAALVEKADPDTPVWTWSVGTDIRWWMRRMLHETTIHRCDAELALGLAPGISADIAADGIDEFLTNLPYAAHFAPAVAKLNGNGERIGIRTTDTDDAWLVTLNPTGFTQVTGDYEAADAELRGPAADLYLRVLGRTAAPELAYGDPALVAHWTTYSAF